MNEGLLVTVKFTSPCSLE